MSGNETATASSTTFDLLIRSGERFGVPAMVLAAFLWMSRELATSIHGTVVVPIVKCHTEFLDSTRETLGEISHTQRSQAETLRELTSLQCEIREAVVRREQEGN